jgi:hypothetical protein
MNFGPVTYKKKPIDFNGLFWDIMLIPLGVNMTLYQSTLQMTSTNQNKPKYDIIS